ncbi:hypothetical protein [Nitrospira moscoviensis]|uniref:Uncharacterized protein n=1 Tax=Nitrospira moscoviensis TaxID=42253 RepID=A0A0K2GGZ7_NITMO|nr:hypothetical protein [Nitrospira moscoviensis]ALA60238.1 hypothetical protein NITMOv2_3849 [Nitrospira moscoviensis]
MADITISSLLLFFLSIPGYIARTTYHTDEFSKAVLPKNLLEDLAGAVLFSFPVHYASLLVAEATHHWTGLVPDVDFVKVIRLLSATFDEEGRYSLNEIVESCYSNWVFITGYIILALVLSLLGGKLIRHLVWIRKWDLRYPAFFKFRNYWLYRLTGRGITKDNKEPNIRFVHALIQTDKELQLYSGLLFSFIVDENGELLDLLLVGAKKSVGDPKEKEGRVLYDWLVIPGNLFVLKYATILNLNIYYYHLSGTGQLELLEVVQKVS